MGQRNVSIGPGVVTARPLTDPGVLSRLAPFVGAGVIVVVLALLPPTSSHPKDLAAAAVLLTVLVLAALFVPWTRFPDWCQASLPMTSFAFVALLRHAENRRSWDEQMDRELARARRTGDPLTVAILDMDHFKAYNDAFGHLAGDVLLTDLVTAVRAEPRTGDVIARWGGEEFALALPDCDLAQAQITSARLLRVVPSGQTASIGLTRHYPRTPPRLDRTRRPCPLQR